MNPAEERLMELLLERGERALTDAETQELRTLVKQSDGWHQNDIDFAAAAAHFALDPPGETMPEALKARIIGDAVQRAAQMQSGNAPAARAVAAQVVAQPAANDDDQRPSRLGTWLGWSVAAAAAVFAVVGWQDQLLPAPSLAEQRAALVEQADAVTVAWSGTDDPAGGAVKGDVVWSESRQEGFMRFAGLPRNDPAQEQYQLWIFDGERDERYPVDGGVFDIDQKTGEVIVPIRAKVKVSQATLFAVTVEKPGGVVVSTRERLVAVAKPS